MANAMVYPRTFLASNNAKAVKIDIDFESSTHIKILINFSSHCTIMTKNTTLGILQED